MTHVVSKAHRQIAQFLARNSRKRAKRENVEHSISWQDIEVPDHCPITGLELAQNIGVHRDNSYTLDRVDPSQGYVKGNVRVLSWRANKAKADLTVEQLEKLLKYMKGEL